MFVYTYIFSVFLRESRKKLSFFCIVIPTCEPLAFIAKPRLLAVLQRGNVVAHRIQSLYRRIKLTKFYVIILVNKLLKALYLIFD